MIDARGFTGALCCCGRTSGDDGGCGCAAGNGPAGACALVTVGQPATINPRLPAAMQTLKYLDLMSSSRLRGSSRAQLSSYIPVFNAESSGGLKPAR
jgi:hypothetical protein